MNCRSLGSQSLDYTHAQRTAAPTCTAIRSSAWVVRSRVAPERPVVRAGVFLSVGAAGIAQQAT